MATTSPSSSSSSPPVKVNKSWRRRLVLASVVCIAFTTLWQGRFTIVAPSIRITYFELVANDRTSMSYASSINNTSIKTINPILLVSTERLEEDPLRQVTHHKLNTTLANIVTTLTNDNENITTDVIIVNGSSSKHNEQQHLNNTITATQTPEEDLPRPHPHAGAKDEHGQWGYIHDPWYVKNHPLPFTHDLGDGHPPICEKPFGRGEESAPGYEGLKRIEVAKEDTTTTRWPKILCIIYTHSNRHETLLRTVVETYAPHCDGFMAASNLTDRTLGAVHLPHEGPETYKNMWNKVRSIWSYVHDNYSNDFDYFHIGGDDMYVIPQNLRQYLASLLASTSSFQNLGGIIGGLKWKTFCGGAGGYTLNRSTLKLLVEVLLPSCGLRRSTSMEDVMMSNCFLRYNRLWHCNDTRDAKHATRYHQNSAAWQMTWDGGSPNIYSTTKLVEMYNFTYLPGKRGLSRSSISFHLKHSQISTMQRMMKRYHVILFPTICQSWNTSLTNSKSK